MKKKQHLQRANAVFCLFIMEHILMFLPCRRLYSPQIYFYLPELLRCPGLRMRQSVIGCRWLIFSHDNDNHLQPLCQLLKNLMMNSWSLSQHKGHISNCLIYRILHNHCICMYLLDFLRIAAH